MAQNDMSTGDADLVQPQGVNAGTEADPTAAQR